MVWRHARVASPRTPGLFLLFADPERCCCDPASSSREPDHFLPRDLQSRLRSPSVLGQTPSSGSVSPMEKTVRALSGWAAGANDVAAEGGPGGRLGRVHRSVPSRKEERSRPRKEERHVQRHRRTRRKTAASGPRNLWLQGTRRSSCFPGRQSLWPGKSKAKPNGKKPVAEEKKVYLEPEYTKSRITDFGFKELVVLPREIDLNEWLASNTTTFFHHVNLQYSTISEFCTGEACQTMAVCNTQYYWYDERGKKVKCTAPQYVDFVMSSVQKLVTDEDVFPTKYGREFPSSFESLVKKICKYLFHVLAHIYSSHFKETLALELHGHLNTLYVHFILFAREFNLLDPKETAVMDDLTEVLCGGGGGRGGGDGAGGAAGAQNHVKER
ncbi:MOB kinase activator 2 isoform X1 [Delphinapterus leucas]|uniref:MOB kinase activator 2 n=2 Tax=Odontoceti TaxID=9722 RepID=A0A7F8KC84_DELLE|nr:MOB kinase activator 2 isoform X1 [Delphinapterus leucas]